MKISKDNYNKMKTSIEKFLTDNKLDILFTNSIELNNIHNILCLIEKQPKNINSINFKKKYKVNVDNYFNDFYLNDKTLNDVHLQTCFSKIARELNLTLIK